MKALALGVMVALGLLAAGQQARAKDYVYLLTGQSNSLGAVKGSPATPEQLERYASTALLWNGNMVRDTGALFETSPRWAVVAPQLPRYGNLCMGPEYGFAHMMMRHGWRSGKGDRLYILKASLDGGGNSFWQVGRPAWISMTESMKNAFAALPGEAKVQALLYLQGESDKGVEITQAAERFLDLFSRLQKVVRRGLRFAVVGECATWKANEAADAKGNTTAACMYAMTRKKKNIGWVRTRDLTKITAGDYMGVHYDGKSQITIGARYAYAVAVLENLPFTPTRGDDAHATLDSPAAWWGEKIPGAADVATWDVASANAADTLAKDVAWAGIAVADPFRGEVRISPAAAKKPVLHLGAEGLKAAEGCLTLLCAVECVADQTWRVGKGCKVAIGSAETPVELGGKACIRLQPEEGGELELHLRKEPATMWRLPEGVGSVRATIGGQPAEFVKQGDFYKLVRRGS